MSDTLLLLSPNSHKIEPLLSQSGDSSGMVGVSNAISDTALLLTGNGVSQSVPPVSGAVSKSVSDQLDIILSKSASFQQLAGQFSGSAKPLTDKTELSGFSTANVMDQKAGTAVSAFLSSSQSSGSATSIGPATSLPEMKFLNEETALKVTLQDHSNAITAASSQHDGLLRAFSRSSGVTDQLRDIISSTQGRPYQSSNDVWIQPQQDSINLGQTNASQVRQSLTQLSAQHGVYDSVYSDVHGRAPRDVDRQYAATMIGNGRSLQDDRWNEAHSDNSLKEIEKILPAVLGRDYWASDDAWRNQTADAIGRGELTLAQARWNVAHWDGSLKEIEKILPAVLGRDYWASDDAWRNQTADAIGRGELTLAQARWNVAHWDGSLKEIEKILPAVLGRDYWASDDAWRNQTADAIGRGELTLAQARWNVAHWDGSLKEIEKILPAVLGRDYWASDDAWRNQTADAIGRGELTLAQARWNVAHWDGSLKEIEKILPAVLGRDYWASDDVWRNQTADAIGRGELTLAQARWNVAHWDGTAEGIKQAYHAVFGRNPTRTDITNFQNEIANGRSLIELRDSHFTVTDESIFSNPSLDGPNLAINTQGVVNGQVQFNDKSSTLSGDTSPDWGVIQWRGQSALDPSTGTTSQVWDKNYGDSVGHWTQGSTTSATGKTDYNVFRDPKDGHYVYQMAAQGGNLLDVQLSTLGSVDRQYSFDHQITASLDQGISDYHGSTGVYQAGVNFTINYHSSNLNFGIFLQCESVDYRGTPEPYFLLPPSLSGSIYNVSGSQTAYINPLQSDNNGKMYHTEINVNQGLMSAIKAMSGLYPQYASELQNLSNWYLDGVYIGVETIGSGLTTDVSGKYNVKDPVVIYDHSKKVSYADWSRDATIVSMAAV